MDTKRLSPEMEQALSKQMNLEDIQSHIYLSYGIWADSEGYGGTANFLFRHAQEERDHAIKFMEYVLERGGKPTVDAIPKPDADPKNLKECFDKVFKHEVQNTTAIYKLVDMAFAEKDWATWNFLQWFVKEQIEEEKLASELIDKLKIAGGDKASNESIYELDRDLEKASGEAKLAREASGENP